MHSCKSSVEFIGYVNEPNELLENEDIFVSPSLSEGLPNSVMEALSCGTPVVLSDIASHKEIDSMTGPECQLFETGNPTDLARTIEYVVEEYDLSRLSQKARQSAVERFSSKNMFDNYLKKYSSLLS
jgi:glycosyltransferase involved in cell wall biosynthesis